MRTGRLLCLMTGCADEMLAGEVDASASTSSSSFSSEDSAVADAAAQLDAGAEPDTSDGAVSPADPFWCSASEPCAIVIALTGGDCAQRPTTPCSERSESALEARLSSCNYEPSYNPLELLLQAGCVTTLRLRARSKADAPEVRECLIKELGALRFDCADGDGRLLLYRDTLALP